jgi:hypothetical protein
MEVLQGIKERVKEATVGLKRLADEGHISEIEAQEQIQEIGQTEVMRILRSILK